MYSAIVARWALECGVH